MQKKLVVLFIMILLAFLGLAVRMTYINQAKSEEYTRNVLSQQQYSSKTLPYKRGDILDAKGTKLAISEKVYKLIIDCKAVLEQKQFIEPTLKALEECFPDINIKEVETYIKEHPTRRYYVVDKKRKYTYDEVKDFKEIQASKEHPNVKGVYFEEEYKRVYPNGSLACDVIGFTIKDDESAGFKGNYGMEAYYNDILNGTNGREYGYLNEDLNLERTTIPATDGYNLISTIDANIQSIVEKYLLKYNEQYKDNYRAGNGAMNVGCIIMDVNSGGIKAMANYPNYDLNKPNSTEPLVGSVLLNNKGQVSEEGTVITEELAKEIAKDNDVLYSNLNALWKNFCISNTYEPGSTAKPFTMAAGLESGTLSGDEYYTCKGALRIGGYTIKCHNYRLGGCGTVNIQQALEQSCNVALMLMGEKMGKDIFLEYQDRFNFGLKTNVDLSGEARTQSLVFNQSTMGPTELATSTFGQSYNVTMIQMITGFCSLINGGNYYEPHVVSKIVTGDGALVQNIEPRVLKQTVSEDTSALIRQYCKGVVDNGTGKTARPAGYSIGGKTGTAEIASRDKKNYVVSFMGFAPVDDPEIAIYVVVDRPNISKQDDAKHATLLVRSILTEVLPYLNIFMTEELSDKEIKELEELNLEITMDATSNKEESVSDNGATENATGDGSTGNVSGNGSTGNVSGNGTTGNVTGNGTTGNITNNGTVGESNKTQTTEKKEPVTDANGGDITSSITVGEGEGDTAPMTGTLLDPITGEPVRNDVDEDSPY